MLSATTPKRIELNRRLKSITLPTKGRASGTILMLNIPSGLLMAKIVKEIIEVIEKIDK